MKDQRLYLIHIKECIEKIEQYTEDGELSFSNDPKTQDAVIRNFEIIGEAVKCLSEDTRQTVSEIPWRQFAGMTYTTYMVINHRMEVEYAKDS